MACAGRPHLLAGEWSVQPLMADLCTALEAKGRECVESAPPQGSEVMSSALFNKLLRTCRFLVTLLVKLTKVRGVSITVWGGGVFVWGMVL